MPSFILVAKTSRFISRHHESGVIKGIFMGLRPVVVGLIASAALLLMNGENFGTESCDIIKSISICIGAFSLVMFTRLHPILIILLAGMCGYVLY